MEQAHHAVLGRHGLHDLHGQLVVVGGQVRGGIDGGQLMLSRCHFVVLRLGQNAQFPEFLVEFLHERRYPGLDGAEIVVIQLLALGRAGTEERPAGVDQVRTAVIERAVHQEILLLRSHAGPYTVDILIAEQMQDPHGLPVERLHRPQQRGLFVQRFAAVGAKCRGNIKGMALHKSVGGGIPGGIAPGLEGGPQAAGGERRGVRLSFNQFLAGKLQNHPSIGRGGNEAVVLFRGDAGHGLEPVGKMGGALFHRPVLHGGSHRIGHRQIQLGSLINGLAQGVIHLCRQAGLHHPIVKYHAAKILRYTLHNGHLTRKIKKRRCAGRRTLLRRHRRWMRL